jgi:hypothetical protein
MSVVKHGKIFTTPFSNRLEHASLISNLSVVSGTLGMYQTSSYGFPPFCLSVKGKDTKVGAILPELSDRKHLNHAVSFLHYK